MLTTAGDTFLTSGAKLSCCISAVGEVIVSAEFVAGGAPFVVDGFSAQTNGDSASVAPSPKPSAAARPLLSRNQRPLLSLRSVN